MRAAGNGLANGMLCKPGCKKLVMQEPQRAALVVVEPWLWRTNLLGRESLWGVAGT